MSINIESKPEMNVVNVGDELTQDQINALNASAINGSPTATNPYLTRTNTFNTTDTAVRITQTGSGDAFRVEDETGDTTSFVINADGRVGINGAFSNSYFLNVNGNARTAGLHRIESSTGSGGLWVSTTSILGPTAIFENVTTTTADCVRITNLGSGNSFVVEDSANPDSSPVVIDQFGALIIGKTTSTAGARLDVVGNSVFTGSVSISTSGSTPLAVSVTNTASGVTGQSIDYRGTGDAFRIVNNTTETLAIDVSGNIETAGTLKVDAGGANEMTIGSGGITFPDATVQSTAYTGAAPVLTIVDTSSWDFTTSNYALAPNTYVLAGNGGGHFVDELPTGSVAYVYFGAIGYIQSDYANTVVFINGAGTFDSGQFAMVVSVGGNTYHVIHTISNN